MIVAVHAEGSGTRPPVPAGHVRRIAQEPAAGNPRPARGLSEAALAHARQAAAQAPPLRPGTVERVRQIIFGGDPASAEREAS